MPITKHNYLVKDTADLGRVVQEAFYIAGTGRPGPVLIDIPKDVSTKVIKEPPVPEKVILRGYNPTYHGHKRRSKKPSDAGCRRAPAYLCGRRGHHIQCLGRTGELATQMSIPVTTTLMGLGCIPCDHPLNLGMLGMHGTEYANFAVTECDCLFSIGVRFDDRVTGKIDTFAPHATIVHIDIDPAEIGKNKKVDVPIVGDCKGGPPGDAQDAEERDEGGLAEEGETLEGEPPAPVPVGWRTSPAVYHPADQRAPQGDADHRLRGRAEPDVDGTVFLLQASPGPGSPRVDSGRWDMGSLPRWGHIMPGPTTRSSMSRETVGSR